MDQEWGAQEPLVHNSGASHPFVEVEITRHLPTRAIAHKGLRRARLLRLIPFVLGLVCLSLGSALLGAIYSPQPALDKACAAHTAQWSPLLQDVSMKYSPHQFNGTFLHENVYRVRGSKDSDEAWDALGINYRAGIISKADGLASGLTDSYVQRSEKYGGGFFVNVQGLHHLHCLNLLRQSLYFNHERYKKMGQHAFSNNDHILELHISHCLEILRQVLMCNVDTAVLGQVWVDPESPTVFPDFNTKHFCKNYDDVQKWAEKIQESLFLSMRTTSAG